MASNASRGASRFSGRAFWAAVGIGALAVVVLGLSLVALTENRNVAGAGATPGAVATTEPAATTAPPAEPSPAEVAAAVVAPTRVLAVLDGQRAVRAGVSACPMPTTVEVTDDAGASWAPAEAATVAAVQRLQIGGDGFVSAIGADAAACAPSYERSFTDGAAWEAAPEELAASWYFAPAGSAAVHAPGGAVVTAPCPAVVQLAVGDDDSAAVLCADSTVLATDDAGASWTPGLAVGGARAIAASAGGYVVATSGGAGCAGAQVVDVAGGTGTLTAGTAGVCVGASAGAVAIAAAGSEVWIWVDDFLGRSADLGETWS